MITFYNLENMKKTFIVFISIIFALCTNAKTNSKSLWFYDFRNTNSIQLVIEYKVASEFRSFSRTFIEENNIIDLLYNSIMSSFNEKKNINRKVTLTRNHGTRFVLTITINRVDYDDCESDGMITLHDTYKNEDLIISGFNVNGYNDADIKVRFEKTYSKLGNQLNLAFTKRTASGSKFENNYLSATREEIEEYERLLNPK
jgi:hypothetical protein